MATVSQGKPLELHLSLPSFPVTTQRISLRPLALLLLLLWLTERALSTLPPFPASRSRVKNRGERLRGKSLFDQRDPAGFQINQQKPQTLIHPATHIGGEWDEIT